MFEKRKIFFILIFAFVLLVGSASAKRFTSQFCEFELPNGWQCVVEGSEWVCQSLNKDRQKEAIIILAAKLRGEQDTLENYMAYLKKTKTFILPGGKTQVSEPSKSELSKINGHRWVNSLHLSSEVPGFYTRYLATVKDNIGVAVTFSVGKDFYAQYQPVFDKIIASLRVFRPKNFKKINLGPSKTKEEDLLDNNQIFIPDDQSPVDISQRKRGSGGLFGMSSTDMFIYLVIAAMIAFFIIKNKKGKGKKKSKSKSKKSKK